MKKDLLKLFSEITTSADVGLVRKLSEIPFLEFLLSIDNKQRKEMSF